MSKKLLVAGLLSLSLFFSLTLTVSAKKDSDADLGVIPEKNGDYQDPEHKGVRVRVFVHDVHEPKSSGKPSAPCSDPDSLAVVHAAGWKLPAGVWTYNLNLTSVPGAVGAANFGTITTNGFNQWQVAENKATFTRGVSTTKTKSAYDGQNVITWGKTSGNNVLAVTYVRYMSNTHLVLDVDTIFNSRMPWSWTPYVAGLCGNASAYDAQAVLTHEQGHWLGLDDEYAATYVNNTMYGYGTKGDIKADTLTTGDKSGAASIYP